MLLFCYTELHGVLHGVTQSFFSPSCYFVIIFCCIELHGVLHGVTQSFFSSFVLLCDNFLLHRVARSFVRCFTELLFPPYYFVIIFCCIELHGVLHGVSQSIFSSVVLCEHSVVLCETFFYCTQSLRELFFLCATL